MRNGIITEIHVEAFLTDDELAWLDAEVERMNIEEGIREGWSRETVLETMLQIAIDRARGVDEDPAVRSLKERLHKFTNDAKEVFGGGK